MCEGTSASAGASFSVGTRVFESRMEVGHNTSLTPLLWVRLHFRLAEAASNLRRFASAETVPKSLFPYRRECRYRVSQQQEGGNASEAHSAAFGGLVRCNSGGWSAATGTAQSRRKVEVEAAGGGGAAGELAGHRRGGAGTARI